MQKILLITPPFTQLNTAYPATAYLKGFLNTQNIESHQVDLSLEVFTKLFSKKGLTSLFQAIEKINKPDFSENILRIISLKQKYIDTIDLVISFLQDKNPMLANSINSGNFLPEAFRFSQIADLEWAFGTMGNYEKAKHLATLYLEEISDLISQTIDSNFGLSRYAEQLGRAANSFDEIENSLQKPLSLIDNILVNLLAEKIEIYKPTIVAITIPFPGNLYSALRCGQWLKKNHKNIKIVFGGGFCNTELRSLSENRVFKYTDFITIDDGEAPILQICKYLDNNIEISELKRTFTCENGIVKYSNCEKIKDFSENQKGCPDYSELPLNEYVSGIELANPMHSLWSNGRWNKLSFAHGCYWAKCSFCDISLDYIKRYEPVAIKEICDRVEKIILQTGQNGFHFVDEAAPPLLLKEFAKEIIRRKITISWWTNIRFEKSFTPDLCELLSLSGCIAVSGGLEVASPRILKLINKGVTVEQVATTANNFTENGIMVHAYLMYGFPTQTEQETIDSLEVVRQLFMFDIVQSGFWHHFAMTCHSGVGQNPEKYETKLKTTKKGTFANNDVIYTELNGINHDNFAEGLRKSLYNFMHGVGFDLRLQNWFEFKVPKTKIPKNYIEEVLLDTQISDYKPYSKVLWTGNLPSVRFYTKNKKGKSVKMSELKFNNNQTNFILNINENLGKWLCEILQEVSVFNKKEITFNDFKQKYVSENIGDFEIFLNGNTFNTLKENGLLIV